jgi:hypothetical protein
MNLTICTAILAAAAILGAALFVPQQIGFTLSYGIVVGMLTVAGISLGNFFHKRRYYMLAICSLALVGLFAVMRWRGEFGERIFGAYTPFIDYGFYFGAAFGVCMIWALWDDQRGD